MFSDYCIKRRESGIRNLQQGKETSKIKAWLHALNIHPFVSSNMCVMPVTNEDLNERVR